ncbi:hypothetical protein [Agaribacterium haliotis]|uniref:hypothetical protein n=1 Tax=Agaribacterium haliotis TaxID=2013869 RepID=UPI000BB59F02|nr:hypothetical protein [Agaribacterium haliotis]
MASKIIKLKSATKTTTVSIDPLLFELLSIKKGGKSQATQFIRDHANRSGGLTGNSESIRSAVIFEIADKKLVEAHDRARSNQVDIEELCKQ